MVALLRSKVCDDPNAEFQEFWQAIDEQNPDKIEEKFKPNFWNLPGPGKSGIRIIIPGLNYTYFSASTGLR